LIEWLRADLVRRDATVERIPELLSTPAEVLHIEFGDVAPSPEAAPSPDFVLRWFAHVLGASDAEGIVISEDSSRLNPALSAATLDELRAFNVLNNPAHADVGFPFAKFDGDPEMERAFARLNTVRYAFFARDANAQVIQNLLAEMQNLRDVIADLSDRSLRARIRRFLRG
jgi:hypothetical protein